MNRKKTPQVWKKRRLKRFFQKHRDGLRSLLIVVLVAALAVQCGLLWSRMLPESSFSLQTFFSSRKEISTDNSAGAMPIRFAARSDSGLYGVEYNTDGLAEAYEATADIWAQALEHAAEPSAVRMEDYRSALTRNLLLMEYDGSIPVHILAGWLGCSVTDALEECALGTAVLCSGENNSFALYFRDSRNGKLWCAQTSVDTEAFDAAAKQFDPNGCVLAADEEDSTVSPDLLYFCDSAAFDVVSFGTYTGADGMDTLLEAFGMHAEVAQQNAYNTDGMTVYVSGSNTIRLASDGSMVYEGTGVSVNAAHGHDRLMQYVQTGYKLTGEALEAIDCGAAPALIRAYTDEDSGRYIVVYGIQVNGVPVDNAVTGYFARYEFARGMLVHANLALRTCQTTGETVAVMPEKQAAASQPFDADMRLSLRYVDEAKGTGSHTWNAGGEDMDDSMWRAEDTVQETETDIGLADSPDGDADIAWDDTSEIDDSWITDEITDTGADDTLGTAWYDNTGTAVSPQWYVMRHSNTADIPNTGRTLSPEDIAVVQADFDRLIRGGGAA
ncbi:MAG: hypothetical protein LUE11_00405 [Clostridia bacterium]|nr:hypothetical protein [Clostridia bacterium]